MSISLPERSTSAVESLTPRQIVAELDKYVVGQHKAKRAVAIALRNRMRRQKLAPDMADEVAPKNILMIGPTGVGKTEIARRLARLAQSPFIKVEASKFTEVGYVGRDVESMVRDLVELAIDMVREERRADVRVKAHQQAEERLLDLLLPPATHVDVVDPAAAGLRDPAQATRERLREQYREGRLDHRTVEIETREQSFPSLEIISGTSVEEVGINLKEMLPGMFQGRARRRRLKVPEAFDVLTQEEEQKLIDMDSVSRNAIQRVEQSGIIFIDEIDKVAGREGGYGGPDVSREGVQRDILPIVEGTTVNTKYGMVKTDHILFIAAGAFHVSKPSDLDPGIAGPLSHPRRARAARHGRVRAHPDGASGRAHQAIHGSARHRGRADSLHGGCRAADREDCDAGQRADREHRRAPSAHGHGTPPRRGLVRRAGPRGQIGYD